MVNQSSLLFRGKMSHLRTITVDIKNCNQALLEEALKAIADGWGTTIILDGRVRSRKVDFQILTNERGNSYGVSILEDGKIQVIGDSYGSRISLNNFQQLIKNTYTQLALRRVLGQMGYSSKVQKTKNGTLVVGVQA